MSSLEVSRAHWCPRRTADAVKRRPPDSSRLERRVIARIDRLREELLLVVSPEMTDVVVGLYRLVPIRQAVFGAFFAKLADIEIADHVAEVVELDRSARRVGQADPAHRGDQLGDRKSTR